MRLIKLVFAASIALSAMALIESSPAGAQVASAKPLTCVPFYTNVGGNGTIFASADVPINTDLSICLEDDVTHAICDYSIEYGNFGAPYAKEILSGGTCSLPNPAIDINLSWSDGGGNKVAFIPNKLNAWQQVTGPAGDEVSNTVFTTCVQTASDCLVYTLIPPI